MGSLLRLQTARRSESSTTFAKMLWVITEPDLLIVLCSLYVIGAFAFLFFLAAPVEYYRSILFHDNALWAMYLREGVRSRGEIIKRWTIRGTNKS